MYRILSASKDCYITDKYIAGNRVEDANTGQAGTLDLFKLYNETDVAGTSGSVVELSRLLLKFDYSEIESLRSSVLDITDSSFQCLLSLKDVYGGQTTPSNFTVIAYPLSKSFDEGRGLDVVAYRDIDVANFLTASVDSGVSNNWVVSGAAGTGSLGQTSDIVVSGNIGAGVQALSTTFEFARGDEDMLLDVTPLVSASLAGILDNHGFRISFIEAQEEDESTYFVKRFGSKQAFDRSLQPRLIVKYSDQLQDSFSSAKFDLAQSFFTYNHVNGEYRNFFSGSTEISGANVIAMEIASSRSVNYVTQSWSVSHSASISHLTRSFDTFSTFFTGSSLSIGGNQQAGIYKTDFSLSALDDSTRNFLSGANDWRFQVNWKSLDGNVTYATDYTTFRRPQGVIRNVQRRNWVVNITNLRDIYTSEDVARLRVFVQDYNTEQVATRVPTETIPTIVRDMRWRLKTAYGQKDIIPFDVVNKLSYDGNGMYFDLYMKDLDIEEIYQLDFVIKSESGKDYNVINEGFRFKVVK